MSGMQMGGAQQISKLAPTSDPSKFRPGGMLTANFQETTRQVMAQGSEKRRILWEWHYKFKFKLS